MKKKLLSAITVAILSLDSTDALTIRELSHLQDQRKVGANSPIDPSVDPIRGYIVGTQENFLYNLRFFAIESSGHLKVPENIEEEFWNFFDSPQKHGSPLELFRAKMALGKLSPANIHTPITSFLDTSSNPIAQLVIDLFPSSGSELNHAGMGSFSVLFGKIANSLAKKLTANDWRNLVSQLHQKILHKNENFDIVPNEALEQYFIEDQIIQLIVSMIKVADGYDDEKGRKKTLQEKMQRELDILKDKLSSKSKVKLSSKQNKALASLNNVDLITISTIREHFQKDKEIQQAIDNFLNNFKELKEISDINSQQKLVGQTLLLLAELKKYMSPEETVRFLGDLEPLKQKLSKVYKSIQEAVKREKLDVEIRNGEYPGKYPVGATKDIINAYACAVITAKNAKDYCEILSEIAPRRENSNTDFLSQAYQYFRVTPDNCTPWEFNKDVPTSTTISYHDKSFSDCVETAIRMFFCFLFYNPFENHEPSKALETLEDKAFTQFFSGNIKEIAQDESVEIRKAWAQILYFGLPDFPATDESDVFFKHDVLEPYPYELKSNIRNVLLAICRKLKGYKASKIMSDQELSADEFKKAQLQKQAEEYIKSINLLAEEYIEKMRLLAAKTSSLQEALAKQEFSEAQEALAALNALKGAFNGLNKDEIRKIFQALVSIRPDEIEVSVEQGWDVVFKPQYEEGDNKALLHVGLGHSKMYGPKLEEFHQRHKNYPQGQGLAEIFYDTTDTRANKNQKLKDLLLFTLDTSDIVYNISGDLSQNLIFPIGVFNLALKFPDQFSDYEEDINRFITSLLYAYADDSILQILKKSVLDLTIFRQEQTMIDHLINVAHGDVDILTNALQDVVNRHGLHWTYRDHSKSMIRKLICAGADFNRVTGHNGENLLQWAIENDKQEIAQLITSKKEDVQAYSTTLLDLALENKMNELAKDFLRKNITVDENKSDHLLSIALNMEDKELVGLLVKRGANINIKDDQGMTLLFRTVVDLDPRKVRLLISLGADINAQNNAGSAPLLFVLKEISSIKNQKNEYEQKGSRFWLHIIQDIETKLNRARNIVSVLIAQNPDLNLTDRDGKTLLHCAIDSNEVESVRSLLKQHANVNSTDKKNRTPLHYAIENQKLDMVKILLEKGADINIADVNSDTPLNLALQKKYETITECLLFKVTDINAKDSNGQTLLHLALQNDHTIDKIIEKGADITIKDNNGDTPLHYACRKGNEEAIDFFLDKGVGVNIKNNSGNTPLHYACQTAKSAVVESLLERGADINVKNNDGNTPLLYACENHNCKVLKLFLDRNTNISVMNNQNNTPLHLLFDASALMYDRGIEADDLKVLNSFISKDNVNIRNSDGKTPLSILAQNAKNWDDQISQSEVSSEMAMLCLNLINEGADIDEQDSNTKEFVNICLLRCFMQIYFKPYEAERFKKANKYLQEDWDKYRAKWAEYQAKNNYINSYMTSERIEKLIAKCTNVNLRQTEGDKSTLLHWAVATKMPKLVELLLDRGADIEAEAERDEIKGATPLHMALNIANDEEMCALLISRGADIRGRSYSGKRTSTIFKDARWSAPKIIDKLAEIIAGDGFNSVFIDKSVEKVPGIETYGNSYTFLLMCAIKFKANPKSVEIFISKGANVHVKDHDGKTPLHYAVSGLERCSTSENLRTRRDIVNLLIAKGADIKIQDTNGRVPLSYVPENVSTSDSNSEKQQLVQELRTILTPGEEER